MVVPVLEYGPDLWREVKEKCTLLRKQWRRLLLSFWEEVLKELLFGLTLIGSLTLHYVQCSFFADGSEQASLENVLPDHAEE